MGTVEIGLFGLLPLLLFQQTTLLLFILYVSLCHRSVAQLVLVALYQLAVEGFDGDGDLLYGRGASLLGFGQQFILNLEELLVLYDFLRFFLHFLQDFCLTDFILDLIWIGCNYFLLALGDLSRGSIVIIDSLLQDV